LLFCKRDLLFYFMGYESRSLHAQHTHTQNGNESWARTHRQVSLAKETEILYCSFAKDTCDSMGYESRSFHAEHTQSWARIHRQVSFAKMTEIVYCSFAKETCYSILWARTAVTPCTKHTHTGWQQVMDSYTSQGLFCKRD